MQLTKAIAEQCLKEAGVNNLSLKGEASKIRP